MNRNPERPGLHPGVMQPVPHRHPNLGTLSGPGDQVCLLQTYPIPYTLRVPPSKILLLRLQKTLLVKISRRDDIK